MLCAMILAPTAASFGLLVGARPFHLFEVAHSEVDIGAPAHKRPELAQVRDYVVDGAERHLVDVV